ncbi:TniQ family protein [Streptomyces sp. NPDC057623]|uniref:TniQ family protein n=1 Tax=Streptomyces sp. NPDC057623 TaxID=3346187 RepID=UPI003687F82E
MTGLLGARRLPALPRTVAPLHRESWDAYLKRLARANRLSPMVLLEHLDDPHRITPEPRSLLDALCDLSGQPPDRLMRAIPDLQPPDGTEPAGPASARLAASGWKLHPACGSCLRRKGITEILPRPLHWAPASTRLCVRHRRWTDDRATQFALHTFPEVIHAQRRHHRLSRRLGWRPVVLALRAATEMMRGWWEYDVPAQTRHIRMTALCGPGWTAYDDDPRVIASAYPETVALTGLLAAPGLGDLPFTGDPADMRRFIGEVRTRVLPDYHYDYDDQSDPLVRWIAKERRRRTLPDPMTVRR